MKAPASQSVSAAQPVARMHLFGDEKALVLQVIRAGQSASFAHPITGVSQVPASPQVVGAGQLELVHGALQVPVVELQTWPAAHGVVAEHASPFVLQSPLVHTAFEEYWQSSGTAHVCLQTLRAVSHPNEPASGHCAFGAHGAAGTH